MKDVDRERSLRKKIEAADKAYYDNDNPVMTDDEYDKLRRSYEEEFGTIDYVPGNVKEGFVAFKHPAALLSLDKIYDDDSAVETKIAAVINRFKTVCVQPKIDGLTIAAYPQSNGSYSFVTRGRGGIAGEILPAFIPAYEDIRTSNDFTIRGEAFITKHNFDVITSLQKKSGEEPFSNPRNAAAGILRNKERSPYLSYLSYLVYEIPGSALSVKQQIETLKETVFDTVDNFTVTLTDNKDNCKELLSFIRGYFSELLKGDIPVDGVVIKAYDMDDSYNKLGQTQHHPNNATAWKRAADSYETTVTSVVWQVGRDKVTPVAMLKPVEIDGTIVSKATLHNLGFFKKLKLKRGDNILICKSGEVIPKVLSVIKHGNGFPISSPTRCPSCGHVLEVFSHDNIADLRCVNNNCPERIVQNIAYLASKDVFDIRGLSESTARKIVTQFDTANKEMMIFDLTVKDILKLQGFAQKSAENLYGELLKCLQTPITIPVLFKACCITGIGGSAGAALEKRYHTLPAILEALKHSRELETVDGIGKKTAAVLTGTGFQEKLGALIELFDIIETQPAFENEGPLAGTTWVITGKLPLSRTKVEDLIQSHGGDISGAVSKKVDYLLTADVVSSSSKSKKARELGIKIVTYDYLLNLLGLSVDKD